MDFEIDYSEVPCLIETINFLPIDALDKQDISSYIESLTISIALNYRYEQYQMAYFALHLLYMTYIYCTVWKISRMYETRYRDAIILARYDEKTKDGKIDLCAVKSIFDYSCIREKECPKILSLIGLDDSQIKKISNHVNIRNNMAHASGNFEIATEIAYRNQANDLLNSIQNIHNSMNLHIRKWFQDILKQYHNGEFNEDYKIEDIIYEYMIQESYLSVNELLVCNEMSVRELTNSNQEMRENLISFKQGLKKYCSDSGYI